MSACIDDRIVPIPAENTAEEIAKFHERGANYFDDVVPPVLDARMLVNSTLFPSRELALDYMPAGGVCAEVGTQTGYFAKEMIARMSPSKFHIYDIDYTPFDRQWFEADLASGRVELHKGDSSSLLAQAADRYFDFIYIDGDHSYAGVCKDLAQAGLKVKDDGIIACNDYTIYSPLEGMKYGIPRAVNEFCAAEGFEVLYLALHPWGYHDIGLCRRGMAAELKLRNWPNASLK
jgi:hypothetical protein